MICDARLSVNAIGRALPVSGAYRSAAVSCVLSYNFWGFAFSLSSDKIRKPDSAGAVPGSKIDSCSPRCRGW
jgi:hypothetical protein